VSALGQKRTYAVHNGMSAKGNSRHVWVSVNCITQARSESRYAFPKISSLSITEIFQPFVAAQSQTIKGI